MPILTSVTSIESHTGCGYCIDSIVEEFRDLFLRTRYGRAPWSGHWLTRHCGTAFVEPNVIIAPGSHRGCRAKLAVLESTVITKVFRACHDLLGLGSTRIQLQLRLEAAVADSMGHLGDQPGHGVDRGLVARYPRRLFGVEIRPAEGEGEGEG